MHNKFAFSMFLLLFLGVFSTISLYFIVAGMPINIEGDGGKIEPGDAAAHAALVPGLLSIFLGGIAIYFYLRMENPDILQARDIRGNLINLNSSIHSVKYIIFNDAQKALEFKKDIESLMPKVHLTINEYINSAEFLEYFSNTEFYKSKMIESKASDSRVHDIESLMFGNEEIALTDENPSKVLRLLVSDLIKKDATIDDGTYSIVKKPILKKQFFQGKDFVDGFFEYTREKEEIINKIISYLITRDELGLDSLLSKYYNFKFESAFNDLTPIQIDFLHRSLCNAFEALTSSNIPYIISSSDNSIDPVKVAYEIFEMTRELKKGDDRNINTEKMINIFSNLDAIESLIDKKNINLNSVVKALKNAYQ